MLCGNRQLVVQGGPGSGKTWLALEQAFRYAKDDLRVLLLCYNVALAEQLAALVAKRKFETGKIVVRSWAALARELLETAGLEWHERRILSGGRNSYIVAAWHHWEDIFSRLLPDRRMAAQ
jgi:superfamily II DNA or RNA helicase